MNTAYGHIELFTEYPKNDHVIRQIVDCLQKGKVFALYYAVEPGEDMAAMIYNPKTLKALHTNGDLLIFETQENFTDSIRLSLISYPNFMGEDKFLNEQKIILIE